MDSKTFQLPNVADRTDWEIVENDLRQMAGVREVHVNHDTRLVSIIFAEPASWSDIHRHLLSLGYVPALDDEEIP